MPEAPAKTSSHDKAACAGVDVALGNRDCVPMAAFKTSADATVVELPRAHGCHDQALLEPCGRGQDVEASRANLLMMFAFWAVVWKATTGVQAQSFCHSGEKISDSTSQQVWLLGRLVSALRLALREAREGLPAAKLFMMFCTGRQQQRKVS